MKKQLITLALLFTGLTISGCDDKEYIHVGPNWDMIHKIQASQKSFDVNVSGVKSSYKVGDKLAFNVTSEKTGKLWIVQVDPNDEVTMIMPNQLQSDNNISAGQSFSFPPKNATWSAPASEPTGESVLAFIVTTGDADLNTVLSGQTDKKSVMQKTFRIIKDEPAWGLKTKVVNITQ
ncbi:MAG TPA: DUF4384 domain-containing protein [Aeromonadales bacterium]|nr:DUF4384 domain-containing protein [Aeromonadales bacterium]